MAESDLSAALRLLREVPGGVRPAVVPTSGQYVLMTTGERIGVVTVDERLLRSILQAFTSPVSIDCRETGRAFGHVVGLSTRELVGGRHELLASVCFNDDGHDWLRAMVEQRVPIEMAPGFTSRDGVAALISVEVGAARRRY